MVHIVYPKEIKKIHKVEAEEMAANYRVFRDASMTDADKVRKAILDWPGIYMDQNGDTFKGMPVSAVPSQLIRSGYRRVSHMGKFEFEHMGLEIREARYVGGCSPKKFCDVVVAEPITRTYFFIKKIQNYLGPDSDTNEIKSLVLELGGSDEEATKVAKELGR